jgi:phosphoribosylanthranilate isomerase
LSFPAIYPVSRTRIKICGLTRAQDVAAAVAAGADALGFVFYEASPRFVTPAQAQALVREMPPFVTPVGLFVNASPAWIDTVLEAIPSLVLQFHGDETALECQRSARPYLRAARMTPDLNLLDFAQEYSDAQALLLDAHVQGYGGAGKVFDWSLIPPNVPRPLVLSGGLHAKNVVQGIMQVRPWAVDVSSGVESAKGIKDAALIHQFCAAVAQADQMKLVRAC